MKKNRKLSAGAFLVLIIIIAAALGLFSCRSERKDEVRIDRIILVILDTLRADHLGCYGYPRETSPFIDTLASGGCIFTQAYAPMPSTVPSHASIFTSYYPRQLNVLKNGHLLADEFVTLAEVCRGAGYPTAAVVSVDHLFDQANLNQGFDYYDQPDLPPDVLYRPADQVVDATISWLDTVSPESRFFLWVHFYDPHAPYQPPDNYLKMFRSSSEEKRTAFVEYLKKKRNIDPEFFAGLPYRLVDETIDLDHYEEKDADGVETMLRFINAYDGEVRFADRELKRLYEYFLEKGLNRNCLWVIASDHGEGLGNHNWIDHGKYLFNELIRVALIFYSADSLPAGRVSAQVVNLVDVLPTLVDLAPIENPAGPRPEESAGISLAPLLTPIGGEAIAGKAANGFAFAQRRQYKQPDPDDLVSPHHGYEGDSYSLQSARYKYILNTAREDEFYDLERDPGELENYIGRGGEAEVFIRMNLLEKLKSLKSLVPGPPRSAGRKSRDKLKALGYFQ